LSLSQEPQFDLGATEPALGTGLDISPEVAQGPGQEFQTDLAVETDIETEGEAETELETEFETEFETEQELAFETESETETETEVETEAESEAERETEILDGDEEEDRPVGLAPGETVQQFEFDVGGVEDIQEFEESLLSDRDT
jgi:hypothetical protein